MKNKLIKNFSLLLLAFSFLGYTSCSQDETCRESRDVKMTLSLYVDSINPVNGRWTESKISVGNLSVQGVGVDSLILNNAEKVSSFKTELNIFEEESKFILDFGPVQDIITIKYKNNLEFLSMACGAIYTQIIDTAFTTGNLIDSITVIEPRVNTIHVENIKLHIIK